MLKLVPLLGSRELLKTMCRLVSSKRLLYVVFASGEVVHWAFMSIGFCRFYQVTPGAIVIGPLATPPEHRGHGYAGVGMCYAVKRLREEGHSTFYIDTSVDNIAMQRVLKKCGFGEPEGTFEREWL